MQEKMVESPKLKAVSLAWWIFALHVAYAPSTRSPSLGLLQYALPAENLVLPP